MFSRKRKDSDFSREVETHIELEAERLRESGMSAEEALAAARRAFGNVTAAGERFHESRRWLWWDHLRQDLRLAVRLLKKTPGWTLVAALTVSLGIGAAAAIFSIVNAVLIRPLPFPHAEQVYWVTEWLGRVKEEVSPAGDYFTMRENARGIASLAAYDSNGVTWTAPDGPQILNAGFVTRSFFDVLGVQPLAGRVFNAEEDLDGGPLVVLLSYNMWQQKFGGRVDMVGQTIRLNRAPAQVIGIMPRGFDFPAEAQLWIPSQLNEQEERARKFMQVVQILARAGPSTGPRDLNAELQRLTPVVEREYPAQYRGNGFTDGMRIYARPLQQQLTGNVRPALLVFAGAVGLMLLIVCFNVANLMLARATTRRREIAVRVALGAPRRRIVNQLAAESLLVALLGGAAGLGLAAVAIRVLNAASESGLPQVSIDSATAAFAFCATVLCGLIFGLVPALGSRGFDVQEALKKDSRSASAGSGLRRVRQALVVVQLGLSLTLLIGAGLLTKSFLRLRNTDPGFRAENVLTGRLNSHYTTHDTQVEFFERVLDQVRALPGVESAAAVNGMAFGGAGGTALIRVENRPPVPRGQQPRVSELTVSPNYFHVLRVPLMEGRMLTSRDNADAPLAVVINQTFARQIFPGEDPIGHRITLTVDAPVWYEIVGVVGDIHQGGLDQPAPPTYYVSYLQQKLAVFQRAGLLLRTTGDPRGLIQPAQKLAAAIDPDEPLYDVKTLQQRLDDSLGSRRFDAALLGSFAAIAALLAAVGVYGVMSYLVTLRTSEICIRLALGARPSQVLRAILREGVLLAILGGALGIAGAVGVRRYVAALVSGVSTVDAATYAAFTGALMAVVLAACWIPGSRAARVDPVTALRQD
ncbi:MAG TPA: ABC transporter permease [Bryobacteraceae bacterium]|jgi:putative ABC transport system permease protein